MKVKIGNTIFDSEKEPILLILNEEDQKNITNMKEGTTKFCSFPSDLNIENVKKFMKYEVDNK